MIERYALKEMLDMWTPQNRFELWLEIECLLVEAFEAEGSAPEGTAKGIRDKVRIDPARILEIEQTTHHDVIAFLTHVEEQIGGPSRFLHLGLTSSDVVDTAFSSLLVRAADLILEELDKTREIMARRAREFADAPMIGRTHGMHAEPTTFGLVLALFKDQLDRDRERLVAARENMAIGKLSGAVGTYAHLEPHHEEFVLSRLGLKPESAASQVVQRDRHAQFFTCLACLASTIERIAVEIRHLQRTELGEAEEPFRKGQKGSSAMPHKRNPIRSENLTGLARVVRSNSIAAMENVALWHERDISHSSVERVIGPDSTTLMHFMYRRLSHVMDGLVVYRDKMKANLDKSRGFPFSQNVLLALVRKGIVRQKAYEMVQAVAMACYKDGGFLFDALAADEKVGEYLSRDELESCFDLSYMLRHTETILGRVLDDAQGA